MKQNPSTRRQKRRRQIQKLAKSASSDADFLDLLNRRPHDDYVRLSYAAWLEENGDPRGVFLRTAVTLGPLPLSGDQGDEVRDAKVLELRRLVIKARRKVSAKWLGWVRQVLPQYAAYDAQESFFRYQLGRDKSAASLIRQANWYVRERVMTVYPTRKAQAVPSRYTVRFYGWNHDKYPGRYTIALQYAENLAYYEILHTVQLKEKRWVTECHGTNCTIVVH